jgi:thiol-disulfide isomerase/thioredoxin
MKLILTIIFNFLSILIFSQSIEKKTPNSVLSQTLKLIENSKSLKYNQQRDVNTDDVVNTIKSITYLENNETDTLLGVKYIIENSLCGLYYNGTEYFETNKTDKTIKVSQTPKLSTLENSYLYNSVVTLKRNLKNIIEDNSIKKSLSDTIISGNDYYSVSFSIYKKKLEPLGGYFPVSVNMTFLYKIIIDKETKLPFIVYQENYNPEGVMDQSIKVSLTNYEINKIIPDTNFYFSKYTSEYNKYINPKKKPLISVGDSVLNSNLISLLDEKSVSLNELVNGKIVLITFWITNCGYCIESVSKMNKIMDKFENKVTIIGINPNDSKSGISSFIKRYRPNYQIFYNGKEITDKYGVDGYPTTIILKNGVVEYSKGGFNEDEVIRKLESVVINPKTKSE